MADESQGRSLAQLVTAAVLMPTRAAMIVALGAAVVGGRAVRRTAELIIEEGERQFYRLEGLGSRRTELGQEAKPGDLPG